MVLPVPTVHHMILRPYLFEPTSCASYLFGRCPSRSWPSSTVMPSLSTRTSPRRSAGAPSPRFSRRTSRPITSGASGARRGDRRNGLLARGRWVEFPHVALDDADVVELGNTIVRQGDAGPRPGTSRFRDRGRRRGDEEPWLVFTGDSLLVGDVGRPDLHLGGDPEPLARRLHGSIERLLELPDGVLVYPSHYGGSVCGRRLSANRSRRSATSAPITRRSRTVTRRASRALLVDVPPVPADQAAIVAANRFGRSPVEA